MTVVDDVARRVALLLRSRDRVLVAIDGPDAAGKTTFADALAASIDAPVVRASTGFAVNRCAATDYIDRTS